MLTLTDSTFEETINNNEGPVFVDFWAEWCGPCKSIAPMLDRLAKEYDGKVTFAKVDVDVNPALMQKFGLRSVPTMMMFNEGDAQGSLAGAVAEPKLREFIDTYI